ncbi:MAG: serine/threonine-protein kinase [Polyangiales bacterium]
MCPDRSLVPPSLLGHPRFEVRRPIGRGAFGIVYEAHDRTRGELVALKTLPRIDERGATRRRAEFARLAAIRHANVVRLDALEHHRDEWFCSMELVTGHDFVSYVRPPRVRHTPWRPTLPLAFGETLQEGGVSAFVKPSEEELARLRAVLPGLARGVIALHDAGRVHRDLGPANVLVDHGGRVVVLDLDLDGAHGIDADEAVAGTAAYMAPEQGGDPDDATTACDWYAVGVMLFEALTSALPFAGTAQEVMVRKQTTSPPAPSFVIDLPTAMDLDDLCVKLLRRDPTQRAGAREVMRVVR